MDKSAIFSEYNRAKAAARSGKLDANRVNRALGILQMKSTRPYSTTISSCDCQDAQFGHVCKHRIAKMIERRAEERHPKPEPEVKDEYVCIKFRGNKGGAYEVSLNHRSYFMVSPASVRRLDAFLKRYAKYRYVRRKGCEELYVVVRLSGA